MSTARYVREATKRLSPTPAVSAISGLIRWYKADDLALADNSLVSTWPDRSGNGADLTASGSLRPTLAQGRLNGKPGIVFSGAQKLAIVDSSGPTGDITVFAVAANFKRGSSPYLVAWGNAGNFGLSLFGSTATDANAQPPAFILKRSGTWGNNEAVATARPWRGDPTILTGLASGSTTKVRVDKANEISDSGDSGSLDYGSGTIELSIGGAGATPSNGLQGEIFEVLIFNRALTGTEIDTVEDYLDQKWRVTIDHASLVSLYNGESHSGNDYQIGLTSSADGTRWKKSLANPIFSKNGTGWERDLVKDPSVLYDGTQYVLYYSGWTSATSRFQIGRATSPDLVTWTRDSHNPLIALGGGGSIDEHGCAFPTVVYDLNEADATRRWKMWYLATDASGKGTVGYAYSTDGVSWTKYGKVLDVGGAGAWDALQVSPGCVYHDPGGTWYLFYQGAQTASPNRFQGGVATFTNPESTYTKYGSNPTVLARYHDAGTSEALTVNLASGGRTVTVADTSGFNVHEPVFLDRVTQQGTYLIPELARILTIDSSTQLTLEWPVVTAFPTSDSSRIVSAAYNSIIPRAIRQLADGTYELHVIPFQPSNDVAHSPNNDFILRETSARATISTLTSTAVFDYRTGLAMMISDVGTWDELSSENFATALTFIPQRFAIVPFIASNTVVYTPEIRPHQTFAPFISSVTQVYTPTLRSLTVVVPFIPSVTVVYPPSLQYTYVEPTFISSVTHVYEPTLKVSFVGAGVSQVTFEVLTAGAEPNANVTQVVLEILVPWYDGLHVWERTGGT